MDLLKIKFLDFKDFFSLSFNTIGNNFSLLLRLFLVSIGINVFYTIINYIININTTVIFNTPNLINMGILMISNSILYIFITISCILMVRCKFSHIKLNFTIVFDYFKKNIFRMLIISFIGIFFYVLVPFIYFYISLDSYIYSLLELNFIPLLIYFLFTIYFSLRFNFAFFLVFLYDIGVREAFSLSYKITKNKILKLLLIFMCLTLFSFVCSLIFGFNFGLLWAIISAILKALFKNFLNPIVLTLIPIIMYQIITLITVVFYNIFYSFMALNLVLVKDQS